MSKTYKIRKDNLLDAISDVEDFQDLIDELEEKHGYKKYTYTVGFDPVEGGTAGAFNVIVNLDKHERVN